jgi:ABC-type transport system involved in multi-copper enzyme maturation permease subunit
MQIVAAVLCLGLLALTYVVSLEEGQLAHSETHVAYAEVFLGIALLFTTILPATCITTERESQTWTLLLTTTLGRWEILWGKFLGAVRRCTPPWLLLFAHVSVFVVVGIIHPIALVQLGILAAWVILFLTSTGLYFSTRLRHTTTAVIANMALAAGLWALVPLGLNIVLSLAQAGDRALQIYMDLTPFVQAGVITDATTGPAGLDSYGWIHGSMKGLAAATGWMGLTLAVYTLVGLVFLALAVARLRREP